MEGLFTRFILFSRKFDHLRLDGLSKVLSESNALSWWHGYGSVATLSVCTFTDKQPGGRVSVPPIHLRMRSILKLLQAVANHDVVDPVKPAF